MFSSGLRVLSLTLVLAASGVAGAEPPLPSDPEAAEAPQVPEALESTALLFFHALRAGLADSVAAFCDTPFQLEGQRLTRSRDVSAAFTQALERTDLSRVGFHGVRILPAEVMVARWGAPPQRLGDLDLEGAWIAVANFGGRGHVAVFRPSGPRWRAVAYSD